MQALWPALVCISKLCSAVAQASMSFQRKEGHIFSPHEIGS